MLNDAALTGQTQQAVLYFPSLEKHLDISVVPWDRNGFATVVSDITEQYRIQERLQWAAHYDALAGLPNRLLLVDRLRQAVAYAQHTRKLLAVGYLDLDGFKPVNDRLGQEVGDRLLVQIVQRLREDLRTDDTVACLSGDDMADCYCNWVVILLKAMALPGPCPPGNSPTGWRITIRRLPG